MGRGRAKAKQTKVARDLKYNSPNTDLSALQAELAGSASFIPVADDDQFDGDDFTENDPYAKYYDADDEESTDDGSDSADATSDGAGSSD
jgi:hypothetical protein